MLLGPGSLLILVLIRNPFRSSVHEYAGASNGSSEEKLFQRSWNLTMGSSPSSSLVTRSSIEKTEKSMLVSMMTTRGRWFCVARRSSWFA